MIVEIQQLFQIVNSRLVLQFLDAMTQLRLIIIQQQLLMMVLVVSFLDVPKHLRLITTHLLATRTTVVYMMCGVVRTHKPQIITLEHHKMTELVRIVQLVAILVVADTQQVRCLIYQIVHLEQFLVEAETRVLDKT